MILDATPRTARFGALAAIWLAPGCVDTPPVAPPSPREAPWPSFSSRAADPDASATDASSDEEWAFTGSTYAWLARRRGVVDSGGLGIPLDDSDESLGLFAYIEGERERWGFIVDLSLISSQDRSRTSTGTVEVDEDTIAGELDLTYQPMDDSTLRFLFGLRLLDSSSDLRFPLLPDGHTEVTQLDPVIGAQGTWPLGDDFSFRMRADIGGFGLASKSTYQALGLFGWNFADDWTLSAGYRTLGWEFDDGHGTRSDVRLSGALLGIALGF